MSNKILIIEDNVELAENFSLLLKEKGYSVDCAFSGSEGLKFMLTNKPDIILCDIMLPDLNGYKILLELKKIISGKFPVFIFITAKTQRADWRKGMELGADDYLTKPFTLEELLKTITVQLSKKENETLETGLKFKNERIKSTNDSARLTYSDYYFFDDKKNLGFKAVSSIVMIKSLKDYTSIHLSDNKKILIRKPMKYWETLLPNDKFVRIHKQTIVNLDFVEKAEAISSNRYLLKMKFDGSTLEVSQRYSRRIKEV